MHFGPYALMILLSQAAGYTSAVFLCIKSGHRKETVFYTVLLNPLFIFLFAVLFSLIYGKGRSIGLSGLGAAFGLMTGVFTSILIHRDKSIELLASWTVSAALMYSVAKIGCFLGGCCGGSVAGLPVQLVESGSFFVIYLTGLTVFFISKSKFRPVYTVMTAAFIVRFVLDHFRISHAGKVISPEQITVLAGGVAAFIVLLLMRNVLRGRPDT
ncbi:MAG: hypothetical protein J5685_11185 [Clostridiales bacterium]|nr:hypothetical protein [Clostridiales bacterium]